jgi:rare lipoprotein A
VGLEQDGEKDGPPQRQPIDLSYIPDAVPRIEPPCKYGNPAMYEVYNKRYFVMPSSRGYVQRGMASWYGRKFHQRYTSCREPYDMFAMTAAHPTLPLPTYVQVTNLENGRTVVVRVNDRGPFRAGRILDLSYAAAYKLDALGPGTIPVEVKAIDLPGRSLPEPPSLIKAAVPTTESWRPDDGFRARATLPPAPLPQPLLLPGRVTPAAALYLQVGAFTERQNAERLRRQLEQQGIQSVHIYRDDDFKAALYRVRVGPFPNRATAERVGQDLSYTGLGRAHIVP